jgi:hypothetical protein
MTRGVVIHDSAQVAWAMATAQDVARGRVLPLLSAPGAAHWLSPRLFLAIIERGVSAAPDMACLPVLDCGLAAGHALAALRAGCPALVLQAECPAYATLAAAAAEAGALLLPHAPPALDLARLRLDSAYDAGRLLAWLGEAED